jgi:hypothetical protein
LGLLISFIFKPIQGLTPLAIDDRRVAASVFRPMNNNFNAFAFRPIVIIGAPRSGTNMLRDALTSCNGAATWPCDEINAIWRHYNARHPSDELQAVHATRRVRHYVRQAFQRLAHRTGAQWIVEKTCANSLRVNFVRAILPEAKFIFLVRDGWDVVASSMKRWQAGFDLRYTLRKARYVPLGDVAGLAARLVANRLYRFNMGERRLGSWGPRFDGMQTMLRERSLAEVCAEQWGRCVTSSAMSLAPCPRDQMCFVRYETFVAQPRSEIRRVVEFTGLDMSDELLRRVASAISSRSVGKGREELDAGTLARIEPLIQETMRSLVGWDSQIAADLKCKFAA